jgi:flagellar basal body-associated protein FliL
MADEADDETAEDPGADPSAPESPDAEPASESDQPAVDDGDEESDPEEPQKRLNLKPMITAAAVVVALAVVGGILVFTGAMGGFVAWMKGGPSKATVALPDPPVYHEFPEILVDLKTSRCRAPFVKLRVAAEVSETDIPRIDAVLVAILDGFQAHLREQERADLVGKDGTEKLRAVFLDIINKAAEPAKAHNVLFREFLLQ